MRFGDVRKLLDATYRATSEEQLVESVARAMNAEGIGRGVHVISFDADHLAGRARLRALAHVGVAKHIRERIPTMFENLPASFVRASLQVLATTMRSSFIGAPSVVHEHVKAVGANDLLSVVGWDGAGRGVMLAAYLSRLTYLSDVEARALTRVVTHLVSAVGLLDRHRDPSAILSRDGELLEVNRKDDVPIDVIAQKARALARLRDASAPTARVRLASVTPRIHGEWTLVGRFLEAGSDHVVLRRNPAPAVRTPQLTPREQQVLALLEAGHHMKLIAYELGISYATVRVLAARARRRRQR
jgi:DNA-binding CsgD family transcriptional regulator